MLRDSSARDSDGENTRYVIFSMNIFNVNLFTLLVDQKV